MSSKLEIIDLSDIKKEIQSINQEDEDSLPQLLLARGPDRHSPYKRNAVFERVAPYQTKPEHGFISNHSNGMNFYGLGNGVQPHLMDSFSAMTPSPSPPSSVSVVDAHNVANSFSSNFSQNSVPQIPIESDEIVHSLQGSLIDYGYSQGGSQGMLSPTSTNTSDDTGVESDEFMDGWLTDKKGDIIKTIESWLGDMDVNGRNVLGDNKHSQYTQQLLMSLDLARTNKAFAVLHDRFYMISSHRDENGNNYLHSAISSCDFDYCFALVQLYKKHNMSLNETNYIGQTALTLAVITNQPLLVGYLIEQGSNPKSSRRSLLHLVADMGDRLTSVAHVLCRLTLVDLSAENEQGLTPLLQALDNHLKLDKADKDHTTFKQLISLFLKYGSRPEEQDRRTGKTAFFMAIESLDIDLAKMLLSYSTNAIELVGTQSYAGITPLKYLANFLTESNSKSLLRAGVNVIRLLLETGAEANFTKTELQLLVKLVDQEDSQFRKLLKKVPKTKKYGEEKY